MNRLSALILALGLLAGCAPAPAPAPPAPGASAPDADVVERALAAVVLLVGTRADGSVSYGSGVVLDGRGLVVTNAHVLSGSRSLKAMLYEPGRISYTPMDGGLARYLFEYERDLVGARVERVDLRSDLALVRVDADTSRLPRLRPSARPP
ncbi:MAG TPA: serine protease, partial [Polyangiaceae bacterium]|nr:serine protease [Polyangiaceae bacterium]